MSAIINVVVNASTASIQLAQTDEKIKQQDREVSNLFTKIKANWTLISQVATTSLTLLAKATQGTAAAGAVQIAQTGLQVAQTEVAIYRLGVQAVAAFASGNIGTGFAYIGLAGALQTTIIASIATQYAQRENTKVAEELARQLESYS